MLVAIATWGSMPKLIIAGIVMRDVLPVTTKKPVSLNANETN
jgi:hypothetical protein